MSHRQQLQFVEAVKTCYPEYFKSSLVLEVGSLDINGSVRQFFENCVYIGLDVAKGPGVDVVCIGHKYDMPDESFDIVISCECFEHDPYWDKTFTNMIRLCKSGGLVIVSCATKGRSPHGTPQHEPQSSPLTVGLGWDYYKNLTQHDFSRDFDLSSWFSLFKFSVNEEAKDLYFYGVKK
jgi:SAM-dependent methyltransferase